MRRLYRRRVLRGVLVACAVGAIQPASAEVIVHGTGSTVAEATGSSYDGMDPVPAAPRSTSDLDELVGPIALYPDDLVAIILPAATYPLQIVQAARFLDALDADPDLQPDPDWDESVVALLNYPDVLATLDADLDWTWELGQAVLHQQPEVLDAVSRFREEARAAGNLRSDERQRVVVDDGAIEIHPTDPEVLYVPDYEPALIRRSVVSSYRYYPRPYPVYYYPYEPGHKLVSGSFWGLTSVFAIGWHTHNVHVYRYGYRDHPYYGHHYAFRDYRYWRPWPRRHRPYVGQPGRRHDPGNAWRPDHRRQGDRPDFHRRHEQRADNRSQRQTPLTPRSGRPQTVDQAPPPGRRSATVRAADDHSRTSTRAFQAPRGPQPSSAQPAPRALHSPRAAQAPRAVRSPRAPQTHTAAPGRQVRQVDAPGFDGGRRGSDGGSRRFQHRDD